MTNPIAIAPKSAPLLGAPIGKLAASTPTAPDFAGLIAVNEPAASGRTIGASPANPMPADLTATPAAIELASELSALLEKLSGLSEKLKDGPLDEIDLDELENLLAGIEILLDRGAPLPLPETPAFAALADLTSALGLDTAESATAPFDALAGLSAEVADNLRETAPELATRLTGLARTLDGHAAAIQSALADEQAIAATSIRHIESETRLNAAATIEEQATATAEQKPAQPAPEITLKDAAPQSDRSLVRDGQQPAPTADARPAQPQSSAATGTAASTAPTAPELETPDGLTIAPPQSQAPTPGTSSAIRPEGALYQRPEVQVNLPHIAAEISRHVQNGTSRFEIKLNPAELGRIDVRMEVDTSGNVVARLAVERSETLDLLQRDQRALERALADAGLDSAKTELEFSLQQGGGNAHDEPEKSPWRTTIAVNAGTDPSITTTNADPNPYMRGYARLDAVNLWV
ncbi:flagellar hook-length control protein FliK [Pelagibacterium sp. 26DY04]|uniref:flagellar hook-length control protein FliK n=1 Tax=Pelagibacterium sp. 26DY04 TaxID=2967130 RepID=UPI002815B262|nr:flagellar hook-length control protein FliK [Pelagibacterium sp. 26DY04]WMT86241.1 flagellar hook-length control protein FliK [Pelagibacterium sp. 26DY04]